MKRPDKIKLSVSKPPAGLQFYDNLFSRKSIYADKLTEALNSDSCVQILDADKYLIHQLKAAAAKLRIRLVFARQADMLYIKPITQSDQEKRLVLLLREPRTLVELEAKKLELHLLNSLMEMQKRGIAHIVKEKWVLTERGFDLLK